MANLEPVELIERADGKPSRSLTSVNARFEDKAVFDVLHSWWSLREGEPLSQCDVFNRLLILAWEHPHADVPRGIGVRRP